MTTVKPILLAEDNPRDAELALAAMEEHHIADKVVVCHDGAEVLDYLYCRGPYKSRECGNPVVVFLDLKMPKVDGIEVLRQVKSNEKTKTIPVVMLTSSAEERDIVASYSLGVNSYIVKPVDFASFVDEVTKAGCYWVLVNRLPGAAAAARP